MQRYSNITKTNNKTIKQQEIKRNTGQTMDSEQQIQDLNVTIELLTLDKEQLSIEKEILEEKVNQLEGENHQLLQRLNQTPSINPDQLKELQHLHHENNQLKELLQKEKDEKSSLQESFTTQQNQLLLQITELQQQVDSLSQFENIIEKLTNDNEFLKLSLQENQKNIQVLEDALELNEQLDEQQRVQIDTDRKIIESYEVKMNHYEQKFIEKDILLQDIQKKLENMKEIYNQQKQENSDLHQLLLTENQQYQSFEEKLQLINIYQKTIEQTVRNTISDSQTMITSFLQKYRYQTTTTRYEQLYGNLSYSIEETKLLNHEILLLTTITLNFDIQYQLSLLYSTIQSLQQSTSSSSSSLEDQHMAYTKVGSIVLQWYQLSVVLHQHLVHAIVQHLHTSSDEMKVVVLDYKVVLVLKNELEQFLQALSHIVQQTVPLTTVHHLLPPTSPVSNNEAVMVLSQREADNYYSKLVDSFLSLERLLQGYASSPELTSSSSIIVKLMLFSANQSSNSSALESLERPLFVEASYLLIEMIFEAIHTSMPYNNEAEELLRSARLELHTILSSLDLSLSRHLTVLEGSIKTIMAIFTSSSSLFINSYGVFSYPTESSKHQDILKQLKEILSSLRQVSNITNAADTGSSDASLQYYPSFVAYTLKAFTNTTTNTTVQALLVSSENRQKLLQVDYYYLLDKYWKLLTQEHSELFTSSSTSIASVSSISEEVAWKKRCSTIRDTVTDKLFSSSSHLKSEINDESDTPRSPAGKGTIKDNKNHNTALQDLKKQLEIKNEELVIAKQRCLELQEVVNQSMIQLEAASAAAASTTLNDQYEAEKKRLQSEVKTLESALQTMEEKVDQLTRENKQLLKQGSAAVNDKSLAGSVSSSTAGTAKDKAAGRRRSNLDITDTKAIFSALASKEPATVIPSKGTTSVSTADTGRRGSVSTTSPLANTSTVSASMLSVEAEKALIDQIQYWKTLSMKNITASLIPLPSKPSAESKVNETTSKVQTIELSKDLKAEIPQRYDDSMSNLKKVYYESRLQRVKAIKIPSLNSLKGDFEHKDVDDAEKRSEKKLLMSKKYLYYHEPLLFQLVSTQQQQ